MTSVNNNYLGMAPGLLLFLSADAKKDAFQAKSALMTLMVLLKVVALCPKFKENY